MYYKYKCGDEVIRVFVWSLDDDFHKEITVEDNKRKRHYERTIRKDEKGKYFTWNKNKVYLNDWIRISIKELKKKVINGERISADELTQAILTEGIDNVRFIVPLNTVSVTGFFLNGNEFKSTLCKVVETPISKVATNYKITVMPVEADETVASSRTFYTSDMASLIQDGHIRIVL